MMAMVVGEEFGLGQGGLAPAMICRTHIVHSRCLRTWMDRARDLRCPLCRRDETSELNLVSESDEELEDEAVRWLLHLRESAQVARQVREAREREWFDATQRLREAQAVVVEAERAYRVALRYAERVEAEVIEMEEAIEESDEEEQPHIFLPAVHQRDIDLSDEEYDPQHDVLHEGWM